MPHEAPKPKLIEFPFLGIPIEGPLESANLQEFYWEKLYKASQEPPSDRPPWETYYKIAILSGFCNDYAACKENLRLAQKSLKESNQPPVSFAEQQFINILILALEILSPETSLSAQEKLINLGKDLAEYMVYEQNFVNRRLGDETDATC